MLSASRLRLSVAEFGYVRRDRTFWGAISGTPWRHFWSCIPPDFKWGVNQNNEQKLHYTGAKQLPRSVDLEDGFTMRSTPSRILNDPSLAMQTFTREYRDWVEPGERHDALVLSRFHEDDQRFAPRCYQDDSLLWKEREWRQPNHRETLAMLGFLPRTLDLVEAHVMDAKAREAACNSLAGNGFYLMSVMVFFFVVFSCISSAEAGIARAQARFSRCGQESSMRVRVRGTVFQPGLVDSFPGLMSITYALEEVSRMLEPWEVPEQAKIDFENGVSPRAWARLQSYWVWSQLHGLELGNQGPQWTTQRNRAAIWACYRMGSLQRKVVLTHLHHAEFTHSRKTSCNRMNYYCSLVGRVGKLLT